MSTRNDRTRRDHADDFEREDEFVSDNEPHNRKNEAEDRPRKRRWWLYALILLLLFVFFAPMIISMTSLKDTIVKKALGDFSGSVDVGDMSLGWFSPIEIKNVSALDAAGNPLVEVASITTSRPLYGFLTSSDYGQIDINGAVAHVQLRPDGSNLEDAIAELTTTAEPARDPTTSQTTQIPAMTIRINDSRALVTSSTTGEAWNVEAINGTVNVSGESAPLDAKIDCQFAADGQAYGATGIVATLDPGSKTITGDNMQIAIQSQNLPLALAAPVASRFTGPVAMAGYMTTEMQVAYDGKTGLAAADVTRLNIEELQVVAPEIIANDLFVARNISAKGVINVSPSQISGQRFNVSSDLGNVTANGTFDLNQLSGLVSGNQLINSPLEMDGRVDVARVVNMLPQTLGLYEDLSIQSGEITFHASSGTTNGRPPANGAVAADAGRMVVDIEAANILARRGAQTIAWPKPMRINATVIQSPSGLAIENARCDSDFLTVEGSGSLAAGSFRANGDLAQLAAKLSEFADLGEMQMAGILQGNFGWQVTGADGQPVANSIEAVQNAPVAIDGNFVVTGPAIKWPGMPLWQPEKLAGVVQASGQYLPDGALRINNGGSRIEIGPEQFIGVLNQPVADFWKQENWTLNCEMSGRLGGWLAHVQNFADIGDVRADGALALKCMATYTNDMIRLTGVEYTVDNLAFDGYSMTIRDPRAGGDTNLDYEFASGRTVFRDFSISASSISAAAGEFSVLYDTDILMDGVVAFRADVNRVADWWLLQEGDDAIRWNGIADGQVAFNSGSGSIGGQVQAVVTDFVATSLQGNAANAAAGNNVANPVQQVSTQRQIVELWREAKVDVNSLLTLGTDFNSISFEALSVDSHGLKLNAQGTIADLAGTMVTNMRGNWNPDWQVVNGLLDAYTYKTVQLAGNGPYQFTLAGPLFAANSLSQSFIPSELQATTTFGWANGSVVQLPVGQGQVSINLANGIADVNSNPIPFANGAVNVATQIDLRGTSPVAVVPQGLIADRVSLSQETCRQWLKYVTPFAADATAAQGEFSVMNNSTQVPLFDPMQMRSEGVMRLTNVAIGAGPTSEQLIALAQQLKTIVKPGSTPSNRDHSSWLQLEQQDVPYAVENGRVYHEGVKISHDDIQIRTKGSVGFDQTLDMIAEIPIRDEWLGDNRYLQGLKGTSIQIPMRGTVTRPQLDRSALQNFATQLAQQAAGSAVNSLIQDQLGTSGEGGLQQQLNNRVNEEVQGLQNRLFEKIGGGLQAPGQQGSGAAAPADGTGGVSGPIGEQIENGLMNGLNNLLKNRGDR